MRPSLVLTACLASVLWLVCLYSLSFGQGGRWQGLIGPLANIGLAGISAKTLHGTVPEAAFVMFQLTFATITPALVVGGFAERIRFSAVLWFAGAWLLLVYAPIAASRNLHVAIAMHPAAFESDRAEIGIPDIDGIAQQFLLAGRSA